MGRNVLISMLGAGQKFVANKDDYRKALYKFPDGFEIETPFIIEAIRNYLERKDIKINEIIVIGTTGSIWQNFLFYFLGDDNEFSENFKDEIPNLKIEDINEKRLRGFSEIFEEKFTPVVVPYGVNINDIKSIFKRIMSLKFEKYDNVYIDITHGFRSLPFMISYFIGYIKLKYSKIKIKDIFYGMLEVVKEYKCAPVVSLKSVFEFDEWRSASEIFVKTGHASNLVKLLKEKSSDEFQDSDKFKKIKELFTKFNYNYGMGYFNSTASVADNLYSEFKCCDGSLPDEFLYLIDVYKNFITKFKDRSIKSQFNLARDYNERGLYSKAFLLLSEAIISCLCESVYGKERYKDKNLRDAITTSIKEGNFRMFKSEKSKKLIKVYNKLRNKRNNIAHCGMTGGMAEKNPYNLFNEYLNEINEVLRKKNKNNEQ